MCSVMEKGKDGLHEWRRTPPPRPRLAVLMPLWPHSMPGSERLTFSLYTFEGQKMAPREIASISAAATWIITLLSGSDIYIYSVLN